MSLPVGLALGAGISMIITLIAAGILAGMVLKGSVSENAIGYGTMVIVPISAALGALVAAMAVKHQWVIVCASVGGLYFVMLLSITALFFGGQYSGVGITALLILLGTAAACVIGLKGEKRGFKPRKKYRPR